MPLFALLELFALIPVSISGDGTSRLELCEGTLLIVLDLALGESRAICATSFGFIDADAGGEARVIS